MIRRIFTLVLLQAALLGHTQTTDLREQVHLHLNAASFITGETMYFSAYITSAATGHTSSLSSLLYVELIGEGGNPVFQQKIQLQDGLGSGDFFISSLVSTGTYQLLAYTRWMKNFSDYFETPVIIINPFEEYVPPARDRSEPAISFAPEGNCLIAGKENTMVFTTAHFPEGELKGKIINALGATVQSVQALANGFGRFVFTPEAGEKYQLIMEDKNGDFHFFELPAASSEKTGVHVEARTNEYHIVPFGASGLQNLTLEIEDQQNTLWASPAAMNQPVTVSGASFKEGVYRVVVRQSGRSLVSRLFYHPGSGNISGLRVPQSTYATRSRVNIPLTFAPPGNYSVSVRLKEASGLFTGLDRSWVEALKQPDYRKAAKLSSWQAIDDLMIFSEPRWGDQKAYATVTYLPELRGELITGHITMTDTVNPEEQILCYSIIGKDFQVQTTRPDAVGDFTFQLIPFEGEHTATVGLVNGPESYSISLDNPFLQDYPEFDFSPVVMDSATAALLARRSVQNQIENAYYEMKEDSVVTAATWTSQFGDFSFFYVLDEYNRFPAMYEHFIEYIPSVVARNNRHHSKIKVLVEHPVPPSKDPLLLLDGVPVTATDILNFSPYRIRSIGVVNRRFFLGSLVTDGVVSFHTFESNLQGFRLPESVYKTEYQGMEPQKIYTFPDYQEGSDLERIPDYREQLYWNPSLRTDTSGSLEFFTSDIQGMFEVIVEGYTDDGAPVHLRTDFTVVARPN